jgi:hypothetical protein
MDDLKDKAQQYMKMGLGKLADRMMVFPRTFRWTFHPINHDEAHWWFHKLNVDYKNKVIEIQVYDDTDGLVQAWMEDITHDAASRQAYLRHYDGCGRLLYVIDFIGLDTEEHKVQYDYSSSEVLTHTIRLSFKLSKRTNKINVH